MTDSDKATLASIEALLVADRISVAKALETAYTLGEFAGKVAMAKVGLGVTDPVFDSTLHIMSGKATNG